MPCSGKLMIKYPVQL